MAVQSGHLLLNRRRIVIPQAVITTINTGLRQVTLTFDPDPPLDGVTSVTASRVMVIPLAPTAAWDGITHGEPRLTAGIVEVDFLGVPTEDREINVLFWDPHTSICPVSADTYGSGDLCQRCEFVADTQTFSVQV